MSFRISSSHLAVFDDIEADLWRDNNRPGISQILTARFTRFVHRSIYGCHLTEHFGHLSLLDGTAYVLSSVVGHTYISYSKLL